MGLLQNAGVLIKVISTAVDDCIALSHGAINRVEVVTLVSAPALDHVALCIVTDPLAGAIGAVSPLASFGFLIDILAGGFLALVNGIQPIDTSEIETFEVWDCTDTAPIVIYDDEKLFVDYILNESAEGIIKLFTPDYIYIGNLESQFELQ